MSEFPCTQCGICCKNISKVKELQDFDNGNGICKFLDLQNNKCKIYDTRPEICRVDVMYEKYYSKYYDIQKFYALNLKVCEELQKN